MSGSLGGAQGANLVSTIWSITESDAEPVQETAAQMSIEIMGSISRGILKLDQNFTSTSKQRGIRRLCFLWRVVEGETYQ
jgi:hypothetical protein